MRVFLTFVAALFLGLPAFSQTFNGTGGNIPPLATTQTCFSATVTGVGVINGTNGLASVCMNITHGDVGDLEIVLRSPDGTVVPLTMQNGGNGNNFNTTCFTATATQPIKFGTAPFNGSFLPEGHLGAVNNGQNANGTWSLCILDRRNSSGTGTVNSWSLTFSNTTPAPPPPALPACAVTLPSSSSCATATQVCDFNGLCGSTAAPSVQTWPALTTAACFSLQNNSFIRFIAASTTASFSVWIPTTIRPNYLDGGLQMLFFSGTCNGPVTTYGCYEHIYPNSGTGQPTISVISASGLTPGNTYYLMIDGYNGDNCTFTIAANTGINILNISPAAPAICAGQSVNLTATGGNGSYTWSPPTNLNTTTGATVTANPPVGSHTYTVTSTTPTGCPLTKDVTVTVNPLPAAPTATVTVQPTCTTPTGTITITAPVGAGLQYSVNGGPYQASPIFTGLTPGSYNITVQNAAGCTSPVTALSVNAAPAAPAAPTATVTAQPTCTTPTGTITITAPTGAGLQYSVNGGPYQASPIFTGLTPGSYNITVQNAAGCTSPVTALSVNAAPTAPAAPTATVTAQPTCTTPTGTITITAPTGAGLQYSVNGGPYQASPIFTGLTPGSYNITVQNAAGCTSPVTALSVNAAPAAPAAPTATVTAQPTCTTPTGTITITAPTGAGLQYSVNGGPYQASPVFTGLTPGSYNVTVQNAAGCTSPVTALSVNAAPAAPAAPTATVTAQPTCTTPTGTITITAPTGAGLQYSVNGGPYQASPIFTGLTPGSYNVTVQNAAGCTSPVTTLTVNAVPTQAGPLNISTVQPTCTVTTGTIIVTPPAGSNLEFSINGTSYQSSTTFNNVPQGTYNVTVRNTVTGCVSAVMQVTINAVPILPSAPTGSVTIQPTCTIATGEISITSPLGANYEYSLSGAPYQVSPVFSNLAPGTYFVTVRNIISGCVSPQLTPLLVNAPPTAPAAPVLNILQPTCITPDATITVTAPVGAGLEYNINGGSFQSSPVFQVLVQGNYQIRVRNAAGCVSAATTATVNPPQAEPTRPLVTPTQPSCPARVGTIRVDAPIGANIEYSINGVNYQTSNVFPNLAGGNYSVTARFIGSTCVSQVTLVQIVGLTPEQCLAPANSDIYFPSAFTPNGDGRNDGFGPGPKTNLANVSSYTLMVFNRYGEKVFETNNPLLQWDGRFKGKMLANYSYTWVAKYRYGTRPQQMQKGSVTIIR